MKIPYSRNSLRFRILYCIIISITVTIASLGFILISTLRLQAMGEKRFGQEQYLQELQSDLDEIQPHLENYLSTLSSASLAKLLYIAETLHETLPEDRPVSADRIELMQREILFNIDAYLDELSLIIEEKRGRKVGIYTVHYEQLLRHYGFISNSINAASLSGFRTQLEDYRSFLVFFRNSQLLNIMLILAAFAFSFSFLGNTLNSLSLPLGKLSSMAGKISTGQFDIPEVSVDSVNEVNQVAKAFNDMKNSISHYIREMQKQSEMEQEIMNERVRNLKMEQVLKRMELYTMQAQMNPHFLFNTINTGVQLAIVEEAERTADFMENLANLFRFNIREQQFFVTLRHEYEGLMSYFGILKIRFPKTLNFIISADEELLDKYSCPAMVLQPLVENSVLHAFKDRTKGGEVTVSIDHQDPVLILSVKDNGLGIPADTIKALLVPHTHDYQLSSKVMGLENVIQRLYFFYPEQKDVIDIKSVPGEGTEIIIRIHTEVKPCIEL